MKRKTRVFVSLLLTVLLLFGALPVSAVRSAADTLTSFFGGLFPSASAADWEGVCGDDVFWSLDVQSGRLTVYGSGEMEDYTNEQPPEWRKAGKWQLIRSVVVEDGVTRIGAFSFSSCHNLKTATISADVTEIGGSAFSGCSGMTEMTFGENSVLQRLLEFSISSTGLTTITLPDSLCEILDEAFFGTKLQTIDIPFGVYFIGRMAIAPRTHIRGYAGSAAERYAQEGGNSFEVIPFVEGENYVSWTISADMRTMTVYGIGAMRDYYKGEARPWDRFQTLIETVRVEEGIVSIGNYAFYGFTALTRVELSSSVTRIGDYSFSVCTKLPEIQLPVMLTEIGKYAFWNCHALRAVDIPDSVTHIGAAAFSSCIALTSVTLPQNLTRLEDKMFTSCFSLRSVLLPASLTEIGFSAFADCTSLTIMRIPWSVKLVEDYAFYKCDMLEILISPMTEVQWSNRTFGKQTVVYSFYYYHCEKCEKFGIPYVRVPDPPLPAYDQVYWDYDYNTGTLELFGSGSLPDYASADDTPWATLSPFIETVLVKEKITSVGKNAFSGCKNCQSVVFLSDTTTFEPDAFAQDVRVFAADGSAAAVCAQQQSMPFFVRVQSGTYGSASWTLDAFSGMLTVSDGSMKDAASAEDVPWYAYADLIRNVEIGQNVTRIGSFAFACCANVRLFSVPESVVQIGENAFPAESLLLGEMDSCVSAYAEQYGNPFMVQVIRGAIGESLFWTIQRQFQTLTISGTGEIPDYASASDAPWYVHRQLYREVAVLYGVTCVGKNAFADNTYLQKVTLPPTVSAIKESAFADCTSLTEIEIPAGVESVDDYAFSCCTFMRKCTFSEDSALKTIGAYVFANCALLETVSLPSAVETIGESAFSYCESLRTLDLQNAGSLTVVPSYCCRNCRALTTVLFPKTLRTVSDHAFCFCTQLQEIAFPKQVSSVGSNAFFGCDALRDARIFGMDTQVGRAAFEPAVTIHAPLGSAAQTFAQQNGNHFTELVYEGTCAENVRWSYDPQQDILKLSAQSAGEASAADAAWRDWCDSPAGVYITAEITQIADGLFGPESVIYGASGSAASAYAARNGLTFRTLTESGKCGAQLNWTLDLFSGALSVTGTGRMTEWPGEQDVPWHNYRSVIRSVSVADGVASLGGYAFRNTRITQLVIPDSVTEIGACSVDKTVVLYGSAQSAAQTWAQQNGNAFCALDTFGVNKPTQIKMADGQRSTTLSFTPPENRRYLICTEDSADATVEVLDADGQRIAFDDADAKENASVRVLLQADQTYRIVLTRKDTLTDPILLHVNMLYTVRFDANGGADAPAPQEKQYGQDLLISAQTPSRTDCSFKGWSPSPNARTAQFCDGGTVSVDRDLTLYAVWVSAKTLSLQTLTYSFDNSHEAFGYEANYSIKQGIYKILFGDTVKAKMSAAESTKWSGNCFGITCTSAMFNNALSSIQVQDFNSNVFRVDQLQVTDESKSLNMELRTLIEVMQISQKSSLIAMDTKVNRDHLSEMVSLAEDAERTGEAIAVSVCRMASGEKYTGHALTGYAYKRISVNESRLYVYDSNYPQEDHYIVIRTDRIGNPVGWNYKTSREEFDSDNKACFITFVPYSHFNAVWENRGKDMESQTSALTINSNSYSIWDDAGQMVATCENGTFSSYSDSVFLSMYISGDQSVTSTGEIILPPGDYRIRNESDALEWFEVQMINSRHGATVKTKADEVILAVDDASNTNYIRIPAQQQQTDYQLTLLSSDELDYAQVQLTGGCIGNAVEVSQSEGAVSITNASGAELEIDGIKRTYTADDIASVSIQKLPDKLTYRYRGSSEPDLSGMIVCVQYTDGVSEVIEDTSLLQASSVNTRKHGAQKVVVSYNGASADYSVQVVLTLWQRIFEFLFGWLWTAAFIRRK